MRQFAFFAQESAGNHTAKLLSNSFEAVCTNRAQAPLDPPTIKDITNGTTGQHIVKVTPVTNIKAHEIRYALVALGWPPSPWQNNGLFTNSRSMPVNALTPAQNYTFQIRAIGGSTGYSDWSVPEGI